MNSGRQLGSIHCHVLHLLKDIFHLFSFVLSVWHFHWTQTWTKPATGPTDLQTRAYQNQTCVIYRSDREPQPWFHDSQLPWNLHSHNMKVDGSRQIPAPAGFFASLYFCSHTWSLAGPCTCSGMQMITATRSGVYIYIYREREVNWPLTQAKGVFPTWAGSIRNLTCISFVSLLRQIGPRLTPALFDGAIDEKVLKKVPQPQRNLITSIHYLHSEQSWGSPSVIRFICIVNTCPACLCLRVF